MGCVYAEESAIITSLHNLFPCDYSELFLKSSAAGRYRNTTQSSDGCGLFSHGSSSLAREPQAEVKCCGPVDRADLIEKLKA